MMFYKNNKNKAGFTLVELVVTMGVIALLFTSVMLQFRSRNIAQQLIQSKNQYASALALARTYAKTGKICCGRTSANKPTGYGVAVDSVDLSKFYLYAEIDNTNKNGYDSGKDIIVETFKLDSRVKFDAISDIQFKTGKDLVIYYNNNKVNKDMIINIKDVNNTATAVPTTLYYISGLIQ